MILITYTNSHGSGEASHLGSPARAFAVGSQYREVEEASDRARDLAPLDSCTCVFEGSQTAQHKGPFSHETTLFLFHCIL